MKKIILLLGIFLISFTTNAQCYSQIESGDNYIVAIKTDGTLWAWGQNNSGQLGDGTTINKNVPTQIGSTNDWDRISV
jgi:alpha-tubulin suppressor-like RCC1 family protein